MLVMVAEVARRSPSGERLTVKFEAPLHLGGVLRRDTHAGLIEVFAERCPALAAHEGDRVLVTGSFVWFESPAVPGGRLLAVRAVGVDVLTAKVSRRRVDRRREVPS